MFHLKISITAFIFYEKYIQAKHLLVTPAFIMKSKDVKEIYNTTLRNSKTTYEQSRWFTSPQAQAGYESTKSAILKYAMPYISDTMKVLELGPGPGTWTKILLQKAPNAHYDLVDISSEMLKQAAENLSIHSNIHYITSDILSFSQQVHYDFFFSSRMIEYVGDKKSAVAVIAGALKPNGYGYIVTKTPQYNRIFSNQVQSAFHQDQIGPDLLKSLFEEAGCRIIKRVHVTCVFPKLRSGTLDKVLTRICRRLPFRIGMPVSESYALIFQKK